MDDDVNQIDADPCIALVTACRHRLIGHQLGRLDTVIGYGAHLPWARAGGNDQEVGNGGKGADV